MNFNRPATVPVAVIFALVMFWFVKDVWQLGIKGPKMGHKLAALQLLAMLWAGDMLHSIPAVNKSPNFFGRLVLAIVTAAGFALTSLLNLIPGINIHG